MTKRAKLRIRDLPKALRSPPPAIRPALIADGGRFAARQRSRHLEASIAVLAEYFGIADPDETTRLRALVVRLARELGVPAFRAAAGSKRGRKRKWTERELRALHGHVEWMRRLGITRDKALQATARFWLRYRMNSLEAQVQLYHRACQHVRQSRPERTAIASVVSQSVEAAAKPEKFDRLRSLLKLAR